MDEKRAGVLRKKKSSRDSASKTKRTANGGLQGEAVLPGRA